VSGPRDALLRSLQTQRRLLADSVVLTPVDSLPFCLADREHTGFLHGLYLSDKVRDRAAMMDAVIQFAGRESAARDLAHIHALLASSFGAAAGSLRLLAGLQAHTATFMSVARIGQSVMLLPEDAGGHFNTHAILQRLGLRTIDVPIDYERLCVDREVTLALVEDERPDFIFIDRSEGLRYEDFSFIGELAGPTTVFDASHYISPIITGRYDSPLTWGFDLTLFTLHKSFPGPQKAGIVGREDGELWAQLLSGLSTLVSSSHAESSYLVGLSLLREEWLERYTRRLLETAAALEAELTDRGVAVFSRQRQGSSRWPPTHHIWILARDRDDAFAQYERLAQANVHTNYRKLPYGLGYGLRLGTTFSAMAGIDIGQVTELADIVAAAIGADADRPDLRDRVRELARSSRSQAILPAEYWT
jgi:glycine hydroxymethyltransferase